MCKALLLKSPKCGHWHGPGITSVCRDAKDKGLECPLEECEIREEEYHGICSLCEDPMLHSLLRAGPSLDKLHKNEYTQKHYKERWQNRSGGTAATSKYGRIRGENNTNRATHSSYLNMNVIPVRPYVTTGRDVAVIQPSVPIRPRDGRETVTGIRHARSVYSQAGQKDLDRPCTNYSLLARRGMTSYVAPLRLGSEIPKADLHHSLRSSSPLKGQNHLLEPCINPQSSNSPLGTTIRHGEAKRRRSRTLFKNDTNAFHRHTDLEERKSIIGDEARYFPPSSVTSEESLSGDDNDRNCDQLYRAIQLDGRYRKRTEDGMSTGYITHISCPFGSALRRELRHLSSDAENYGYRLWIEDYPRWRQRQQAIRDRSNFESGRDVVEPGSIRSRDFAYNGESAAAAVHDTSTYPHDSNDCVHDECRERATRRSKRHWLKFCVKRIGTVPISTRRQIRESTTDIQPPLRRQKLYDLLGR